MPEMTRGQTPTPTPGNLFASINIIGQPSCSGGAVYQYTPTGVQSTFASGFQRPHGLVFDTAGNLFVTSSTICDTPVLGTIFKFTPDGVQSTFATGFPADFFVDTLAMDNAGNLFAAAVDLNSPPLASTIYKITPNGTISVFGSVPGQSGALVFDSAGNLFVADGVDQIVYKFAPDSTRSVFVGPSAFTGANQGPVGLAFDSVGNLFVSTEATGQSPDAILKFTPAGVESTFATGLNYPRGLAFDSSGNLFVAEVPPPGSGTGDILEFTPGGTQTTFASGIGRVQGNGGPEYFAFAPGSNTPTPGGSNVTTNAGTVGFATISLTFPQVTSSGTTTVLPVNPSSAGYSLGGSSLAFDITTTAAYPTPVPTPPGIVIAFQVARPLDVSQLTVFHNEGGTLVNVTCPSPNPGPTPDTTTNTIYASVTSLSPFVIAQLPFTAQVQQPINADGTSVFTAKRGVVPVKFTLIQNGVATCTLPSATIALTRTAGGTTGAVNESTYVMPSDVGSNFRIDSCQYIYNLDSSALGVGTYRVDIKINDVPVGSAVFQIK
jgi:sugar lactone lactonase YvrE